MNSFRLIVVLLTCIAIALVWQNRGAGHKEFEQLLKGDNGIKVKTIKIVGLREEILIDDPAVIKYITNAICGATEITDTGWERGYSYTAIFTFSSGASIKVGWSTPDNKDRDGMMVNFPYGGDPPIEFWAPFKKAKPPEVANLQKKMGRKEGNRN
jgi:hypothetical protein